MLSLLKNPGSNLILGVVVQIVAQHCFGKKEKVILFKHRIVVQDKYLNQHREFMELQFTENELDQVWYDSIDNEIVLLPVNSKDTLFFLNYCVFKISPINQRYIYLGEL